jgi:beta-lactam-binding protein with PASTA domain/predicted Ser/Thr protein kinase
MAEIGAGTIVDGRYKVLSRLGSGGMADVFLAEDQQLGRKVALKLLHRRFAEDPDFVERFRREAQSAAALQHPNVVGVYDRGSFEDTYYIAMEYLSGRSLKQLIRQEAPLDPVRAIDLTIQILQAARFAHRRGVIHRDLKPHNVIVDDSGHAKVTDFGIARAGASDMTETGSIMGTAQYLSPEQAQGHAVSAGSDLYSVGVVLYEMLTGRVPFDAESAVTIALKHVSEAPAAPTRVNGGIPPELEQVVMWALNKNPADRPQDAAQFISVLEQVKASILAGQRGQRTSSMAAVAAVGAYQTAATAPAAVAAAPVAEPVLGNGAAVLDEEPLAPDERGPRWPWIALAVLLLLLAGGGLAAYLLSRPTKAVVPTVINEPLSTASAQLQNANFNVSTITVPSNSASGIVIRQSPQGGVKLNQGSTVTLTVSSGPGNATVPSVEGLPLAQAKQALTRANLKPGRVTAQSSSQVPKNQVISTDPAAGQTPPVGTKVTIIVSSGKPLVSVPDVTGQSEASAKSQLQAAGFSVGTTTTQSSSSVAPGDVISQSPSGGTQEVSGSAVDLVIAKAPAPTPTSVPDVTGQTAAAGNSSLTSAGFKVVQQTKAVTKKKRNGVVISQSPSAGSSAKKGSTVTIVVGQYQAPTTTSTSSTTTTSGATTPTTPATTTT